jgi:hypothetical protein
MRKPSTIGALIVALAVARAGTVTDCDADGYPMEGMWIQKGER